MTPATSIRETIMSHQQRVLGRLLAQELPAAELATMAQSAGGNLPGGVGTSRRVGTYYQGSPGVWDDGLQLDGIWADPIAPGL